MWLKETKRKYSTARLKCCNKIESNMLVMFVACKANDVDYDDDDDNDVIVRNH